MERKKMTADEVASRLANSPGWSSDGDRLRRRFSFTDFDQSLAFVNQVGAEADQIDHHPDIKMGWGYAEFEISTHDRGGITDKDFELAARIDRLWDNRSF